MIVAVVPARGGSKRFPGKNLALLGGRPLLAWSVLAGQAAPVVDRVLVTTDDPSIAAVGRELGASVVTRPAELATDRAPTAAAVRHALEAEGLPDDCTVVVLQPTNPFRPIGLIEEGLERFAAERPDSVVSVSRDDRKRGSIVGGRFRPAYRTGSRAQDQPESWYENGLLYVTGGGRLCRTGDLFGTDIVPLPVPDPFGRVDIDEPGDLRLAEALLAAWPQAGSPALVGAP